MTPSSKLVVLVIVIAVGAAGWLLLRDPGTEPVGPETDPTPPAGASPQERSEPPAADPAPPAAEDAPVEPPAVTPPSHSEPETAPPAHLYPEQLMLETARWEDAPALDVLQDVARQARFELVVPTAIKRLLEDKRVTLSLENTTGAIVLSRVLVPHSLSYTVRDGRVYVFVDDD